MLLINFLFYNIRSTEGKQGGLGERQEEERLLLHQSFFSSSVVFSSTLSTPFSSPSSLLRSLPKRVGNDRNLYVRYSVFRVYRGLRLLFGVTGVRALTGLDLKRLMDVFSLLPTSDLRGLPSDRTTVDLKTEHSDQSP